MTRRIDLNADLGEGMADDRALMAFITSCNIACGGHAGDTETMREALRLADDHGVAAGAHPAYPDREGFGRRAMDISEPALRDSLTKQIEALMELAATQSIPLSHVKPHGALYHRAEADPAIAGLVAETVARIDKSLRLVGPPQSALQDAAAEMGLAFLGEGFADRAYGEDGRLVPRSQPGAVLADAADSAAQAVSIAGEAKVMTANGHSVAIEVDTLCLHGDTPGALDRARAIRTALETAGFVLVAPK